MTTKTKKRIVRSLLALVGALIVFVGVVGFAHTRKGRFLLAYLPGMGSCPVGKPATPEQIEAARQKGLAPLRGTESARTQKAFGFDVGRSSRTDVLAWAQQRGVGCQEEPKKLTLSCADVPASALEGAVHDAEQLVVAFDRDGVVSSVEAMRRTLSFEDAVKLVDDRARDVARQAGGVPARQGVADGAALREKLLRRAEAELRYGNFRFLVSAVHQGGASPVVRELYQAIDDPRM